MIQYDTYRDSCNYLGVAFEVKSDDPGKSVSKKVKPLKKDLFGAFGFEPTFFPDIELPDWVMSNNDMWTDVYRELQADISSSVLKRLGFDKEDDSGNLETPSAKNVNYKKFKEKYVKLVDYLETKHFRPSSSLCLMSEGGCHINFDLRRFNQTQAKTFLELYRNYVTSNPSIVWMFLSPYDNVSSVIPGIKELGYYKKGDFFTYRTLTVSGYTSWISTPDRIELRHFMMPRNMKEFDVHFEFANKLMLYIFNLYNTNPNSNILSKSRPVLKDYTYDRAIKEFKKVCIDIGFDFSEVVEVGKLPLLKKRFSLGKKYLV